MFSPSPLYYFDLVGCPLLALWAPSRTVRVPTLSQPYTTLPIISVTEAFYGSPPNFC